MGVLNSLGYVAVGAGLAALVRAWLRPVTPSGIVAVFSVGAFFILGWTHGNKLTSTRGLAQPPVNWPLVFTGADCGRPNVVAGWRVDPGGPYEDPVEYEVTADDARRANRAARACIAAARRDGRDSTEPWANWVSILLLGTAGLAIRDHVRRRDARAPRVVPGTLEGG